MTLYIHSVRGRSSAGWWLVEGGGWCVCMQCWGGLANDGAKLLVLLLMMTVNVNARARTTTKRSWNVHTFARRAFSSREEGWGRCGWWMGGVWRSRFGYCGGWAWVGVVENGWKWNIRVDDI